MGFNINGFLNDPRDIDVFSFNATAGTEIWVDLDRTTFAFDPIVELIDGNGVVRARSVNSTSESGGTSTVFARPGVDAFTMQKTPPYAGQDFWTINPRDAGMRVVLPGAVGVSGTYHLRVRSNPQPINSIDNLQGGLTAGAYQMQLRLRELDEVAGSTVRFADIRYAMTGVEVIGQPVHSPLTGEAAEDSSDNDTRATAQNVGNVVTSDRGAISIAGRLNTAGDVDLYQFQVNYQQVSVSPRTFETIFDIDYADGVSRANTNLYIFDAGGNLVLSATDSNVGDDRPSPLGGSNVSDLSRGSVGSQDPYIGTVELSEGVYYAAVTSNARVPADIGQFLLQNPANPLARLEPVHSLDRIAEDHIDSTGGSTAQPRGELTDLIDANSAVPFFLGDVTLFVSQQFGSIRGATGVPDTRLLTVDPFTGAVETVVNDAASGNVASFDDDIGDIALRADGRLFALTVADSHFHTAPPLIPSDAHSGNFLNIDTGNGVSTFIGDDGLETYQEDPANPGRAILSHPRTPTIRDGYGVQFEAMTFGTIQGNIAGDRLIAVGRRGDAFSLQGRVINPEVGIKENLLYELDPATGLIRHDDGTPTLVNDPARGPRDDSLTNAGLVGEILTSPRITAVDATSPTPNQPGFSSNFNIQDGAFSSFTVQDRIGNLHGFEFDAGFEIRQNVNQRLDGSINESQTVKDGYFFILDPDSGVRGDEVIFQIDTGAVLDV
ncbi:MAG TPA: hypothetical protein P5307_18475, partial [Pirellulaceae bacterium]|nr:hypothetical protein [Pirellulaceae bacterium]